MHRDAHITHHDDTTGINYNGRYSLPQLKEMIAGSGTAIFDFCGTVTEPDSWLQALYAARLVRKEFYDTSNAHLARNIAEKMAGNAVKNRSAKEAAECLSYCGRVASLFIRQGLGMARKEVLRRFGEDVLKGIPPSTLEEAARQVANYARDGSLEVISRLADSGKEIVVVTLALRINAEACLRELGINGKVYGNEAGRGATISSPQDKYKITLEQITMSNEPVLVVGNNGDDAQMFKALDDSGRRGVKVAVNSTDKKLLKTADVSADFKSLCRLVEYAQS
ncbi:MAG: HAD family hydrolase [Candidatus Woesearchaeota archaeon]